MSDIRIMLVEDEAIILESIKDYLKEYNIFACLDAREALKELKTHFYDIVVADYRMPGLTGLDLLLEAKKENSYFYGILLTAYAEKKLLEEFINLNLIKKVIEKPLNLTRIKQIIEEAVEECRKEQKHRLELQQLKGYYENAFGDYPYLSKDIIGIDSGLKEVFATIKKVAGINENVLLTGETGTGKELLARTIHCLGIRRSMPFIRINCGAIPENLIESELFGYKKGAFTGADTDKIGKIELAHGGTLFLDEIAELKTELQTRFLHVLQDKEVERLGSNRSKKVDFRLITATNKELPAQLEKKLFREDLYYRISTVPIHIPPLRERIADLPLFIEYFSDLFCREMGKKHIKIDNKARDSLMTYSWPGNIRELENVIKRAIILLGEDDSLIGEQAFDYLFARPINKANTLEAAVKEIGMNIIQQKEDLKSIEKHILSSILAHFQGNIQEAVRSTSIPKDRFYRNK